MPKTEKEIQDLKDNWRGDPCWEIEDTDGFGEYAAALKTWRLDYERQRELERQERLRDYARRIGLDNNIKLAEHIRDMEEQLDCMRRIIQGAGLHI